MMEGLERITARLEAESRAEREAVIARAEREAGETLAHYRQKAEALRARLRREAQEAAAALEERMTQEGQLEGKKALLAVKWEGVESAYALAREAMTGKVEGLETALRLDRARFAGEVAAILYGEDTP